MSALAPPYSTATRYTGLGHLLWVVAAAVLGFLISANFSNVLALPRDWFLVAYLAVAVPFLASYVRWSGVDIGQTLRQHWIWGVVGAVLLGTFMASSVPRMPSSPRAEGIALVWDLVWLGVVYGILDAVLLTVLPVAATWRAFAGFAWTEHWPGKIVVGAVAFIASLVVTTTYHLGYIEFRGPQLVDPLIGNGIMTLGYLLTTNPISAIGVHIALHVASVLHGVDTTISLPPHY